MSEPHAVDDPPPVDEVLEQQREEHEPRPDLPQHEVNDEGVGALVNNTGDDGGAASG